MLGKDHARLAGITWLAGGPITLSAFGYIADPWLLAATAPAVIGASLAPDIDEPGSCVAKEFGALTKTVAWAARTVFRGHRRGTHTWVGVVLTWIGAYEASHSQLASVLTLAFFYMVFARMILPHPFKGWWTSIALALGFAYLVDVRLGVTWLPLALVSGVLLHDAGDVLTNHGLPFLWPFSQRHISLPIFGDTGEALERGVGKLFLLGLIVMAFLRFAPPLEIAAPLWIDHIHTITAQSTNHVSTAVTGGLHHL